MRSWIHFDPRFLPCASDWDPNTVELYDASVGVKGRAGRWPAGPPSVRGFAWPRWCSRNPPAQSGSTASDCEPSGPPLDLGQRLPGSEYWPIEGRTFNNTLNTFLFYGYMVSDVYGKGPLRDLLRNLTATTSWSSLFD